MRILLVLFLLFMSVVLLNLLIAIMGNLYTIVEEQGEVQFQESLAGMCTAVRPAVASQLTPSSARSAVLHTVFDPSSSSSTSNHPRPGRPQQGESL